MAILAYDDVMLREPRLLVPGMQPLGLMQIDVSNPLAIGLMQYLLLGRPVVQNLVDKKFSTISGTKLQTDSNGLQRGFGTTAGVATTDKITTPAFVLPQECTIVVRVNRIDTGGSNVGRIYDNGLGDLFYDDVSATFWGVQRDFTTTNSSYHLGAGNFRALNTPYTFYLLLPNSTSAPTAYVGRGRGVTAAPLTELTPGAGNIGTTSAAMVIGNRADNTRGFPGTITYLAVWSRLLSWQECNSLDIDPYQFLIPA